MGEIYIIIKLATVIIAGAATNYYLHEKKKWPVSISSFLTVAFVALSLFADYNHRTQFSKEAEAVKAIETFYKSSYKASFSERMMPLRNFAKKYGIKEY